MSSASRPKPRPRPRLRAAPATSSLPTELPPSSSPGPSSAVAPSHKALLQTYDAEDSLFLRNQGRTPQMWSQLSKMTAEKENKKRKSSGSSDSSGDDREVGSSPRHRNRRKKPPRKKDDALPDWTRKRPDEIVISSDSEDDIGLVSRNAPESTTDQSPRVSQAQGKPKRARSRSITPPPALPQYAIQRAREAVQMLVGTQPRAASPTFGADEFVETIVLDPELASIAQRVHTEVRMHEGTSARGVGGPEVVEIKVLWRSHPLNPNGRSDAWGFRQRRHDNFYALFGEVADAASVLVDELVVTYEGKRVFQSSNPHSIGIWAEAELEASDKTTYQYLQETKRMRSPSVAPVISSTEGSGKQSNACGQSASATIFSEPKSGDDEPPATQDEDEKEESNTFHLTIRSERTKDKNITLLVRPTTKCGAIVRAFLKKAGLEAEYSLGGAPPKARGRAAPNKAPMLCVDGEKMDAETEIGEADLEDGDQVDVVGL